MGWSNFIVIPKLKIAIEISRNIDENIDGWVNDNIENILNFNIDEYEIIEKKYSELTVKDIAKMINALELIAPMNQIEVDRLFTYWLKSRKIEFEIMSEFDFEKIQKDYIIIKM